MDDTETTAAIKVGSRVGKGKRKWAAHIARAEKFSGSNAEYCRRHGLKQGLFRFYKRKFRAEKRRPARARAFVKVKQRAAERKEAAAPTGPQPGVAAMPDARWTAAFVAALLGSQR